MQKRRSGKLTALYIAGSVTAAMFLLVLFLLICVLRQIESLETLLE